MLMTDLFFIFPKSICKYAYTYYYSLHTIPSRLELDDVDVDHDDNDNDDDDDDNLISKKYAVRHDELHFWTLEKIRVCVLNADLIEVYKMMHGLSAVKFESFFEPDNNKRTICHSCKLIKKRFRTDLRQHFFTEKNYQRVEQSW